MAADRQDSNLGADICTVTAIARTGSTICYITLDIEWLACPPGNDQGTTEVSSDLPTK